MIEFVIFIVLIGIIALFVSAIREGIRRGKKEQERKDAIKRQEQERKEMITRQEKEREERRVQQVRAYEEERRRQEEKRLLLEQKRKETLSNFRLLPGSNCWPDEIFSETEQIKRIDRVYYDTKKMSLECFDTRYNIAKIRGTTWRLYLTNAQFCTCPDFRFRLGPCKHMYFLGNWIAENGEQFIETDYEEGLSDITVYLIGRFPNGKEQAVTNLKERGCEIYEKFNNEVNIAVAGKTKAIKMLEKLQDSGVPIFDYNTALKLFTSEIRHPELEEEPMNDPEENSANDSESTITVP